MSNVSNTRSGAPHNIRRTIGIRLFRACVIVLQMFLLAWTPSTNGTDSGGGTDSVRSPLPPSVSTTLIYSQGENGVVCHTGSSVLKAFTVNAGRRICRDFASLPPNDWLTVSPTGKFAAWADSLGGRVSVGIIRGGKVLEARSLPRSEGLRLESWSPKGDQLLLVGKETQQMPRRVYLVAHADLGTAEVVDNSAAGNGVTSVFWSIDGRSLVFASDTGETLRNGSGRESCLRLWRCDAASFAGGASSVLRLTPLTPRDATCLLGNVFPAVWSVWVKAPPEYGPRDIPVTVISPSGERALIIGEPIKRSCPTFEEDPLAYQAPPIAYRAFLCDGKGTRQVTLSPRIGGRVDGFTWSRDEHWIQTLAGGGWILINVSGDHPIEQKIALPHALRGTSRQLITPGENQP